MDRPIYCKNIPFAPYAFLPGVHPHPMKEGGHRYLLGEPKVILPTKGKLWEFCDEYRHAIDCLNHGYFWESHMWLEAIWNEMGRKGILADGIKGLIKIGAAGLKFRLKSNSAGEGHLIRAKELFLSLDSDSEEELGLKSSYLIAFIDHCPFGARFLFDRQCIISLVK